MSKHKTKYNIFALRAQLEAKANRPYPWQEIADAIGVHRNTVQNLSANRTSTLDLVVADNLVEFFRSQGMYIRFIDLFFIDDPANTGQTSSTLAPATLSATGKMGNTDSD